jgi:hypothetical protein
MSQLQQRGPSRPEKHGGLAIDPPGDRLRTKETQEWVTGQTFKGRNQLGCGFWHNAPVSV